MRIEQGDVASLGWNAIDDNEQNNFAVLAQQLNLIGHLLIDIRDLLERGPRQEMEQRNAPPDVSPDLIVRNGKVHRLTGISAPGAKDDGHWRTACARKFALGREYDPDADHALPRCDDCWETA